MVCDSYTTYSGESRCLVQKKQSLVVVVAMNLNAVSIQRKERRLKRK